MRLPWGECEPRVTRLRQRLARLEEQRQALADEAALHGALQLIIGRLENFAATLHAGLEAANWVSKRDRIRALVKRVEVARDDVNIVCRIDPYPGAGDPEKKSWQLCRGSAHSSWWRPRVGRRAEARVDHSCLPPLAQRGGEDRPCGQHWPMVSMVKAAAAIRVESPWTARRPIGRRRHGLTRLHRAAPGAQSLGVRLEACLPCRFQGRWNAGRPHPVLSGRYAQRSVRAMVLRDLPPADRVRLGPLPAQALVQHPPAGCWGVVHPSVTACRVCALVVLRHAPEGQERVGRGSHQQFWKVFHPLPCRVRGGAREPFLQASSLACHSVPVEVSPWGEGGRFRPCSAGSHRLTSPKIRTVLACSPVRTRRQSAPLRVGYGRVCGPLRPLTGRRSLLPSAPPLGSVPLPDGRAPTSGGHRGLPQLSMTKSVVRLGGSLYPGERLGCRHSQAPAVIRLPSHGGHGLSASVAMSLSRGLTMPLPVRSTFPACPRPPPHRGWQRSEHGPQSFAPRMTRQHVWGGPPGHHGARRGSFSPSSILLHRPSEVSQEYACSLPGRKQG